MTSRSPASASPQPDLSRRPRWRGPARRRPGWLATVGALVLVASAGAARAGVTWQMDRQSHGETTAATVYVEGDNLRIESNEGPRGQRVVLFNAATKKMTILQMERRSYAEMSEEDMKRMRAQVSGQMDAVRAQMEARMKTMTPEQRQMAEQMMARNGITPGAGAAAAPAKEPEWTFQASGQKKTLNGFPCEVYQVSEAGAVKEEDCLSPWSKGLVTKDDLTALMRFAEAMASMMQGIGGPAVRDQMNASLNRINRYPGFPVQRVRPDGEVETLKKIERKSLPASLFAVPAGFTKEDPMAGRGRPGRPPTPTTR